jgi:hypothetical protein
VTQGESLQQLCHRQTSKTAAASSQLSSDHFKAAAKLQSAFNLSMEIISVFYCSGYEVIAAFVSPESLDGRQFRPV